MVELMADMAIIVRRSTPVEVHMPFGASTPEPPPGMPPGEHEIIHVDDRVVACDGGSAGLGHPRVWLRIVHDQTFCPYCSRVFVLNPGAADSGH